MTIVVVLGVSAALVIALLSAPVRIHLEIDTGAEARPIQWQVRWLLATWRSRRPGELRKRRAKAAGRPLPPRQRRRRGLRTLRAAMTTPGASERVGRFLRDVALLIRPRHAEGAIVVGLDDPAETGMLFGAWCSLPTAWQTSGRFRLEPDFAQAAFRGRARVHWSIVPAAAVRLAAGFVIAPVVWRAGWRAWRAL